MESDRGRFDRRDFLKKAGAASLGSIIASTGLYGAPDEPNQPKKETEEPLQMPKRKFGRLTELDENGKEVPLMVPILSLGALFDVLENQAALREALRWGVTYWDTAYSYAGGNSELGIGKFLSRNPQLRKKLFIASKASNAKTVDEVEQRLQESLKRLKTDYVDLYYGVHILSDPAGLTPELKKWAESAKKRKLIRYFGFSTHKNMAQCLLAGAKLDWIDAILVKYSFREMQDPQMQAGIDTCHKAGIALTAMKTIRGQKIKTAEDRKLTDHFIKKGFTAAQAKIKVVLQDKRISSVAVGRGNVRQLRENIAAALDKRQLTAADMEVFRQVAEQTCSEHCLGCGYICESAVPDVPYVSDVLRYLMYHDNYGEKETARRLFAQLPPDVRSRLTKADYSLAEARCPQRIPIARRMAEAARKLA